MISFTKKIISGIFGTASYQKYFDNYVAKNSTFLFLIHCTSILLVFFSNYVLVKVAGTNNYGEYVYIFNLIYLLVSFCMLGLDTLLLKKAAIYNDAKNNSEFKGILFFAFFIVVISSTGVAGLFKVILNFSGKTNILAKINWFTLSFLSLLMLSVTAFLQAILQGMRKIVWSQAGEKLFRPLLLIIFVSAFYYFQKEISLEILIWINVLVIGITMIIPLGICRKVLAHKLKKVIPEYNFKGWLTTSFTFFIADILYNCNSRVSIFLLGIFQSKHDVGIFNISLRISEVISFALVIVNFVLSPIIASLYANGEIERLQNLITRSARIILMIGSVLTLGIILFRHQILSIFGVDFLVGQHALIIFCIGQFVNILCGSVGLLLLMTGNQRFSIYSLAGGTTINIILNLVLTPRYGITGAAIASTSSLIVWNFMMYFFVRRRLGIRPTAFRFI